MGRGGFVEREFTCAACGARFRALAGVTTPSVVVCMHCGLRRTPAKVQEVVEERSRKLATKRKP